MEAAPMMIVNDDRKTWLAERRTGIGSSDAAAILGLSPWRSAWEIYMDKIGELPEVPPTEEMQWGLRLEPAIAQAYQDTTGAALTQPPMMRHRDRTWMLASIDRIADSGRIVELKTANPFQRQLWGEEGSDQVPEQYLIQVQHQMAVAESDQADIAVLLGLADFRIYTVPRNDQLIFDLIRLEEEFWSRVQERRPPEPDWSKSRTREIIKRIRPQRGEVLEIKEADALLEIQDYEAWKAKEKEAREGKEAAQARIIHRMGQAEEAIFADGRRAVRKLVKRQGYTVKPCEFVNFSIKE